MSAINWRERFIAVAVHFAATLLLACAAGALIFLVWFPHGLAEIVGGAALFLLVVSCDVVLGPLVSLVIYNTAKSRAKLVFDYTVIGLLQIAAMAYGVFVVAESRPAYLAFDIDRIEIVTVLEFSPDELAKAEPQYRDVPFFRARLVSLERPTDQKERNDLMFLETTGGVGAYTLPKYYRSYEAARAAIKSKCRPLDTLIEGSGTAESIIRGAIAETGEDANKMCWLLAHHRFGFAVALIDRATDEPIRFVNVSPVWTK